MNGYYFAVVLWNKSDAVIDSTFTLCISTVDELLNIHQKYDAHPVETEQILSFRNEFTTALNGLLKPYDLELVGRKMAA